MEWKYWIEKFSAGDTHFIQEKLAELGSTGPTSPDGGGWEVATSWTALGHKDEPLVYIVLKKRK